MEISQNKAINGGMEGKEVNVVTQRTARTCDFLLRFLALALTLVAAIVLGVDKQSTVVPMTVFPTLPPLNVPVVAKMHHLSAFVYFVVCNAIACSYAAVSLLLWVKSKGNLKTLGLMITILDMVMVALLFSGIGATAAVGLIGYQGNSHVQWHKVCNVFVKFCHQAGVSVVLSSLGSLAFLLLVALAALSLHKKSK